jgi:hypothetical protein
MKTIRTKTSISSFSLLLLLQLRETLIVGQGTDLRDARESDGENGTASETLNRQIGNHAQTCK